MNVGRKENYLYVKGVVFVKILLGTLEIYTVTTKF